jgi:hypothetical protein
MKKLKKKDKSAFNYIYGYELNGDWAVNEACVGIPKIGLAVCWPWVHSACNRNTCA